MADVIGICNAALVKVGATPLVALDEDRKEARLCVALYPRLRDELLRAHAWNFATARARLARLADAPVFGFAHRYRLPADWLRTLSLHDGSGADVSSRARLEGDGLLSDAAALYLRYVARIEDPTRMTPDFRAALASLLARELALPLAQSNSLEQRLDARFAADLRRARSTDALENAPEPLPAGSWIAGR